ncbi:MAG: ArsC/Spx/MgsR family protein [Bacteroidota bacterium]
MLTIYHNPRCKKSRAGLEFLKSSGTAFRTRNYLLEKLTVEELRRLIMKLKIKPEDLVRKQEEMYRKELKGKSFTEDEWLRILAENPFLIRRPIVESQVKAVIGDPPEEMGILL